MAQERSYNKQTERLSTATAKFLQVPGVSVWLDHRYELDKWDPSYISSGSVSQPKQASCLDESAQSIRVVRSMHFLRTFPTLSYVSVQRCVSMR